MKRYVFFSAVFLILTGTGCFTSTTLINQTAEQVAIKGYDTVAYFTEGMAVPGSPDFQYRWQDAIWYFASAGHLELFKAAPEKYAPQYGGYCAWAMAGGNLANIDPGVFNLVDEKLYLNYSNGIQKKWLEARDEYIEQADEAWLDKAVELGAE